MELLDVYIALKIILIIGAMVTSVIAVIYELWKWR